MRSAKRNANTSNNNSFTHNVYEEMKGTRIFRGPDGTTYIYRTTRGG